LLPHVDLTVDINVLEDYATSTCTVPEWGTNMVGYMGRLSGKQGGKKTEPRTDPPKWCTGNVGIQNVPS